MGYRHFYGFGILLAGCNAAPPVPDNPVPALAPDLGATTVQSVSPPAISGGTLLLSQDGTTAIAADPDRDLVSFVDLSSRTLRVQTSLTARDEPGRMVEDAAGFVHVALRGAGELATLSIATGELVQRRAVCAQPRGVAYDSALDQVLVACASGELVTFAASSGPAVQTLTVEPDLRDVVIDGDLIFVTKFRTAELLQLNRSGAIGGRRFLPADPGSFPALAWRMRLTPNHQIFVAYQVDSTTFVPVTPGGYGNSGSGFLEGSSPSGSTTFGFAGSPSPAAPPSTGVGGPGIVRTAIATVSTMDISTPNPNGVPGGNTNVIQTSVLPVDLALPPSGQANGLAVLIAAGNWKSSLTNAYSTFLMEITPRPAGGTQPAAIDAQVTATEILPDGTILLQSREPAALHFVSTGSDGQADSLLTSVTLSETSREDTGHTIFHTNSGGAVACASCHGEGGDDAQTWNFGGVKPRRTPSLLGTVKGTAPYHWDADFADIQSLSHAIYTVRMSGRVLAPDQVSALQSWLEQLPPPKRPAGDSAAIARGQALFQGEAACASCHSGPSYTNNATVDVGTGARLQVPPLVGVGARLPIMHDGCAKTLADRFGACATPTHGQTTNLTGSQIGDLVAFMNSL
ncbi:MAG: c-type cytochrome [Polyangiaceae bacterium]